MNSSRIQRLWRDFAEITMTFVRRRPIFVASATIFLVVLIAVYESTSSLSHRSTFDSFNPLGPSTSHRDGRFDGTWDYKRDHKDYLLDRQQCDQAFPGLFEEVERPVRHRQNRKITLEEIDGIVPRNGYMRVMIYDGEIYVIALRGQVYSRGLATLHSLHRAVVTSPEPLPNIEFVFNVDDAIAPTPQWGYARRPHEAEIWLMPDFGYWSWPETKVGSYGEVQRKARAMEEQGYSWDKKVGKLLWRGASMGLELREKFVEASRDKDWSDVKTINWHDPESMAHDLKSMDEHCQYKYLAHTEGNSYSGRLKYLQNCESVIVAHDMDWVQHHHPLMHAEGPEQNFVRVDRDFEQLDFVMNWLRENDEDASRVAHNSVNTFRQRYLTPAAEACYWRRLIYGYASVSFEPEFANSTTGEWRGLPVESFLLERRLEWDPY